MRRALSFIIMLLSIPLLFACADNGTGHGTEQADTAGSADEDLPVLKI